MKPLRVLIAGCGSIGKRHLRNLERLRPVEVFAYRQTTSDISDLPESLNIRTFANLNEALSHMPEVALIANPTSLHLPIALEAAHHGCHLFIEKPLSNSLEGVDTLISEVRKRGLVTLVAFNMRFHPGLQQVKEMISRGEIGRVLSVQAQVGQYLPDWHSHQDYRRGYSARAELGGGVILDLIHELDLARWMVGEVAEVACFAARTSELEIDTEDLAEVVLRFDNGAIGSVHLDYLQRVPSRTCRLIGSEGTLYWNYFANETQLLKPEKKPKTFTYAFERNDMYREEMAHFLGCLQGLEKPVVDVEEGAKILKLALLAQCSTKTGRAYVSDF